METIGEFIVSKVSLQKLVSCSRPTLTPQPADYFKRAPPFFSYHDTAPTKTIIISDTKLNILAEYFSIALLSF
jgi:hypothetical protein